MRQALRRFAETNVRAHSSADYGWDAAVRAIYVSCYRSRRHGRRDDRPQHWRKYLERTPGR